MTEGVLCMRVAGSKPEMSYSKCPDSVSSHPIRRSAITHHLDSDVPKAIVSERMNVSEKIIDQHYDARDKEQKRQNRQKYLNSI